MLFFNHWWSVNDFLEVAESYRATTVHNMLAPLHAPRIPVDEVSLVVPSDINFEELKKTNPQCLTDVALVTSVEHKCGWVLNMGIELWKSGPNAITMMDKLVEAGDQMDHEQDDAEQGALRSVVLPAFHQDIALISAGEHTWHADEKDLSPNGKWIKHVHGSHLMKRVPHMVQAITEHASDVRYFLEQVVNTTRETRPEVSAGFVAQADFLADVGSAMGPWTHIVHGPRPLEDDGRPKWTNAF